MGNLKTDLEKGNISDIGKLALSNCKKLESIVFQPFLIIDSGAFESRHALTLDVVVFKEGLQEIGSGVLVW